MTCKLCKLCNKAVTKSQIALGDGMVLDDGAYHEYCLTETWPETEPGLGPEYVANVHEIEPGVFGIGHWVQSAGQYHCPLDRRQAKLTGCVAEYSSKPIGRMTLTKARYEARKVYGYSKLA